MHFGFSRLAAAVALLAAAAAPALAQDEDLRGVVERQQQVIEELQRRIDAVEAGRPAEERPAATEADLDAAVSRYLEKYRAERGVVGEDEEYMVGLTPRPSNKDFHFGGYASFLYRSPDDSDLIPAFEGYRVVPQFSFDVSKGIEFATEIEFEGGGAGVPYLTGNYIIVEYAEVRFDIDEAFVAKTGILLIPFLRYNLYHDDPIWNLMDRPFTATRVFRAALQQPGVGAEGVLPFGDGHSFNYNAALTQGIVDNVTNSSFGDARQSFRADNNHDKAFWIRSGLTPRIPGLDAADFGLSYAQCGMEAQGSDSVNMRGWGVDGKVTVGRFDFIFEWANFHYDRPESQDTAVQPTQTSGGFVQLDTRLIRGFPETESGIVGGSSELILAVRAEMCDTNERVTGASMNDDCRAITAGLAFRFTPKTVLRVERREERTRFEAAGAEDKGMWVVSLSTYF